MQLPWYRATLLLLKFCPPPSFQRKCQIVSHVIHLFYVYNIFVISSLSKYENEILELITNCYTHKHILSRIDISMFLNNIWQLQLMVSQKIEVILETFIL